MKRIVSSDPISVFFDPRKCPVTMLVVEYPWAMISTKFAESLPEFRRIDLQGEDREFDENLTYNDGQAPRVGLQCSSR